MHYFSKLSSWFPMLRFSQNLRNFKKKNWNPKSKVASMESKMDGIKTKLAMTDNTKTLDNLSGPIFGKRNLWKLTLFNS
jgi:hypothetical protein